MTTRARLWKLWLKASWTVFPGLQLPRLLYIGMAYRILQNIIEDSARITVVTKPCYTTHVIRVGIANPDPADALNCANMYTYRNPYPMH